MEMISRAAAKMTNSASAGELFGAGIWTLAKTAIELFGASVSKFENKFTSYSIDSSLFIDMTAKRDDGQLWDLGTREDQEKLERMQQEHQTELLIGSARCIFFRTLPHPSEKGTKEQLEKAQNEERQYTLACIKAHKRQLSMGRHFLHEHPVHASSWCMPEMREWLSDGRIHLVQGPMCRWRMTATDDRDEQGFVRGKTRWTTSSSRLATLLAREHAGENRRVRLTGQNETIAGAMYSPRLVKEVLKALGKELVDDGRLDSVSLCSAGPTADFLELDTQEWLKDDYDQQGHLLDPIKVKEGKREEIGWVLLQKLFDFVPESECAERHRPTLLTEMGSEEQGRRGQSTTGC